MGNQPLIKIDEKYRNYLKFKLRVPLCHYRGKQLRSDKIVHEIIPNFVFILICTEEKSKLLLNGYLIYLSV